MYRCLRRPRSAPTAEVATGGPLPDAINGRLEARQRLLDGLDPGNFSPPALPKKCARRHAVTGVPLLDAVALIERLLGDAVALTGPLLGTTLLEGLYGLTRSMSITVDIADHDRLLKSGDQTAQGLFYLAFEGPSCPPLKFAGVVTHRDGDGLEGKVKWETGVALWDMAGKYKNIERAIVFITHREYVHLRDKEIELGDRIVRELRLSTDSEGWTWVGRILVQEETAAGKTVTRIRDVNV
ncbi:hypothetical protein JCM3770_005215 [Rhodotorula araucariae]